jgi:hypothetical protein
MVRSLYACSAGKAGVPDGCVKTAKAQLGEELSLQSLLLMSHGSARSRRGGEAMLAEAVRVL